MAVLNNLYPPRIDTYMPAFLVNGDIETSTVTKTYKTLSFADLAMYDKEVEQNIVNSGVDGVEELWNAYEEDLAELKERYPNPAEYAAHANALKQQFKTNLEALILGNPRAEEIETTFFEEKPEVVEVTRQATFTTTHTTDSQYICRVYFALSVYNKMYQIQNAQITVRNQATNRSALHKTKYPCEIALKEIHKDTARETDDKYYIEIRPEDLEGCNFNIDQFYKVQIRFTSAEAADPEIDLTDPDAVQAIDSGLNYNMPYFSEWSTVCLIRGISKPSPQLKGFSTTATAEIQENIADTQIVGTLTFEDENETETLKSYSIKVYDKNDNLLYDSGNIFSNDYTDVNTFNYEIPYNFPADTGYYLILTYTTKNLYTETLRYNFLIYASHSNPLVFLMDAYSDVENGDIAIRATKSRSTGYFTGKIIIRRADFRDNFAIWKDMYVGEYEAVNYIDFIGHDYTAESGVGYKYAVQGVEANGQRRPMIKFEVPVILMLEDMFLTKGSKQIKIAFNPSVSSFRQVINEQKIDTIGSQYPFIKRNGYNNYAQFPISGMIFTKMDEDEKFLSKEEAYGPMYGYYNKYNEEYNISEYSDVVGEKAFRDKVMEFLLEDSVKLFRSPTEGNYLVKIMDVQFQPNQTLGRRLWTFSATAYQIAETTVENYKKYNILMDTIDSAEGVSISGD